MKLVHDLSFTSAPYCVQGGAPSGPEPTSEIIYDFSVGLPAAFLFARVGDGTFFDSAGVMQTAGTDVARIDHDPITLAPLGLLVEGVSQNTCLQSAGFEAATWIKSSVTITTNQAIAPDGILAADLANPGGGTTQLRQLITVSEGVTYTFSFYAKEPATGGNGKTSYRIYDLSNGATVVFNTSVVISQAGYSRVVVTFTAPAGCTSVYAYANYKSYGEYYVWGAQFEQGDIASSYIPTSGSSATRWMDSVSHVASLGPKDVLITYDDDSTDLLVNEDIQGGWWPVLRRRHLKSMALHSANTLSP